MQNAESTREYGVIINSENTMREKLSHVWENLLSNKRFDYQWFAFTAHVNFALFMDSILAWQEYVCKLGNVLSKTFSISWKTRKLTKIVCRVQHLRHATNILKDCKIRSINSTLYWRVYL